MSERNPVSSSSTPSLMLGPVRCSFCLPRLSYWPLCLPIYQHPFTSSHSSGWFRSEGPPNTSPHGRADATFTSITATFAAWFLSQPRLGLDSKPFSATPASRERNEGRRSSCHLELIAVPKRATHCIFPLWSGARTDHEAHPSVE